MCTSVADADRMVEAAQGAPGPLRVFENFIFYPPVVQAKSLIDEGAIGEPLTIRIKSNPGRSETAWEVPAARGLAPGRRSDRGRPPRLDDGHHKFALAWYFMGPAEEVHAWIGHTTAPDGFVFTPRRWSRSAFPGTATARSSTRSSTSCRYAQDDRIDHRHPGGWINRGHGQLGADVVPATGRSDYRDVETGWETSFVYSTRHCIEALRNGRQPQLSGKDGRDILRFAFAAEESARAGAASASRAFEPRRAGPSSRSERTRVPVVPQSTGKRAGSTARGRWRPWRLEIAGRRGAGRIGADAIGTFRTIREEGYYYVDKTPYLRRLVDEGTHYFRRARGASARACSWTR